MHCLKMNQICLEIIVQNIFIIRELVILLNGAKEKAASFQYGAKRHLFLIPYYLFFGDNLNLNKNVLGKGFYRYA